MNSLYTSQYANEMIACVYLCAEYQIIRRIIIIV